MVTRCSQDNRDVFHILVLIAILLALLSAIAGCATSHLPPPAPPAIEVLVPVTKPCEVTQVAPSHLETDNGVPADIYSAVQQLVADHLTLKADREKLVAANTDPCPGVK